MAIHFGGSKEENKKTVVGQLRRTQLITTFGSGAIADMPGCSVIIAATDYWNRKSPVLHERNLERLLRVTGFRQPYVSGDPDNEKTPDIPAFRFPIMHFCPGCGKLMPYWKFGDGNGKQCSCGKNIVPSRFVAACINGHLEDFPYRWWVCRGDFSKCPENARNDEKLTISFSNRTGGLDSILIKCNACDNKCTRSMAGCMSKDALKGYHCRGKRPWVGMKTQYYDPEPCAAPMRVLQRGASNVYFAITASALTIPPWSSRLYQEIDARWNKIETVINSDVTDDVLRKYIIPLEFKDLTDTGLYSADEIIKAIKSIKSGPSLKKGETYSKQNLMEDEYHVFLMRNYKQDDDLQFRIESTRVSGYLSDYIDDVIMVRRLREILALRGFRRISPEAPDPQNEMFKGYHMKGDCIPLSKVEKTDWLPAIEMLGEGIFIRLNEEKVRKWEETYGQRYCEMGERLRNSNLECGNFSPRYVLLHTLSHLLIRQLSLECGYSGASIKERIYSTYPGSSLRMAGILLYTSSSDSDGSLGGLVRMGETEEFENIFRNMLQEATWCSSDPVCIESTAQGYDSLNYAACHACTLLPETCCEMRNCLLDRGAIVGTIQDRELGFFHSLTLENNKDDENDF